MCTVKDEVRASAHAGGERLIGDESRRKGPEQRSRQQLNNARRPSAKITR